MESLKALLYEKYLSIDDLTYLTKLLETNLPMHQCFELLKNKRNRYAFEQIGKRLQEGGLEDYETAGILVSVFRNSEGYDLYYGSYRIRLFVYEKQIINFYVQKNY